MNKDKIKDTMNKAAVSVKDVTKSSRFRKSLKSANRFIIDAFDNIAVRKIAGAMLVGYVIGLITFLPVNACMTIGAILGVYNVLTTNS